MNGISYDEERHLAQFYQTSLEVESFFGSSKTILTEPDPTPVLVESDWSDFFHCGSGSGRVEFKRFVVKSVSGWDLIISGLVRIKSDFSKKVPNI